MPQTFKTVALIGKPNHNGAVTTFSALYRFLSEKSLRVLVEKRVADSLPISINRDDILDLTELGQHADLAIVVGGDGNMLGAARVLARYDVAVLGVNRGNLGFLTDLKPDEFQQHLEQVLAGEFITEHRFLLNASVIRHQLTKASNTAVNEVVLHPGKIAHMIDFEVLINQVPVFAQRADGLIVSTPTGSTAYSLSGGGPILHPTLNAICLLTMFPHTLSARPLVIDADNEITIRVLDSNISPLQINCDGHVGLAVLPGDIVHITKASERLRLVHPHCYDYYETLRSKLGWNHRLY